MKQAQILWVGRFYKSAGDGIRTHNHPFYHMIFVHAGQLSMTAGGNTFPIETGQCILIPREMDHGYVNSGTSTFEGLEIKFSLPSEALDRQYSASGPRLCSSPLVRMLFTQIIQEYSEHGNKLDDAAEAYLLALLHAMNEETRSATPSAFRFIDADGYSELSRRTIHYLEEHYGGDICLDTVAQAVGHNKSYLCVAFKKNTQITVNDCLNMIRIRRAAELIAYSDNDLTQIAAMCGFSSVSHFNRVFLKHVGTTPGQCRKAYPSDITISPEKRFENLDGRGDRFMYCVLAGKRITPEMIISYEKSASEKNN